MIGRSFRPAALALPALIALLAPARAGALSDDEPANDGVETAPIQIIQTDAVSTASGKLTLIPGDTDFLGIGGLRAGDIVTVSTTPFDSPPDFQKPDTIIGVFSSAEAILCLNDDTYNSDPSPFPRGLGSLCRFVIAADGDYFVGVTGFSNTPFDYNHFESGEYELTVTITGPGSPSDPLALIDAEPTNDSVATASIQMVKAGTVSAAGGKLALVADDTDYLGIGALRAGDTVTISTTPLVDPPDLAVPDTIVGLFSASAVVLCQNDDAFNNDLDASQTGRGSLCRFRVGADGDYFVGVTGFSEIPFGGSHSEIGEYEVTVSVSESKPELCYTPFVDEDHDDEARCEFAGSCDATDPDCALELVAMGDSYSSGEGAQSYTAETSLPGVNECHRSSIAYSGGIALPTSDDRIIFDGDRFLACSGASASNLRRDGAPHDKAPFAETQLDTSFPSSEVAVVNASTELVTLTIGASDIDLPGVARNCLWDANCDLPGTNFLLGGDATIYDLPAEISQRISDLELPLRAALCEIRAQAPNASVWIAPYPSFLNDNSVEFEASIGGALDVGEIAMLRAITASLNDLIAETAAKEGIHLVDPARIQMTFADRGINQPAALPLAPYFNGTQEHFEIVEWFNLNAAGHEGYARAFEASIARQASGASNGLLKSGLPRNPEPTDPIGCDAVGTALSANAAAGPAPLSIGELSIEPLGAPACDARLAYTPSQPIHLIGTGFAPSSSVAIHIATNEAAFAAVLGTVAAGSDGRIDAVVTLPAEINPDGAGVSAVGTTPNGGPIALLTLIEIVDSAGATEDTDLDGTPDVCDNCGSIGNGSQADADGDRIGDACDACANDIGNDADADGLCAGVDPCALDALNDLDGDGLCANSDSDDDGDSLEDWRETDTGVFVGAGDTGTDPRDADTDDDGFGDAAEISAGSDPFDPLSFPATAVPTLRVAIQLLLAALLLGTGAIHSRRVR